MNEKELVEKTIETVKQGNWTKGQMGPERYCLLGSIGKARWGEQWDMDCLRENVYAQLQTDETTRALVGRIVQIIVQKSKQAKDNAVDLAHRNPSRPLSNEQTVAFRWNDMEASEREVLRVLERARAEIE